MPKSDKALCARLAEWREWKPVVEREYQFVNDDSCLNIHHNACEDCGEPLEARHLPECATLKRRWVWQCSPEVWEDTGDPKDYRDQDWSPDTDPVAALELLGWLAKKGWSYIYGWNQAEGEQRFCRLWKHTEPPGPDGKRFDVITEYAVTESKAIAKAADKVLESEVSDE